MNIADVEQRLRAAYAATSELEFDPASQPLPVGPTKPQSRERRDNRFAAGLAAAATVIAVVAGATALISHQRQHRDTGVRPPSFPTSYVFGAKSVPHHVLTEQELEPDRQRYVYSSTKPHTYLALCAFVPDQAMRDALSRLPRIQVGSTQGRYTTVGNYDGSSTNRTPLDQVFGTIPDHPFTAVAWPVDSGHWAAVLDYASKETTQPTPHAPGLAALAATITTVTDEHVAFVKVGYLPTTMRFDDATIQARQPDISPMTPMMLEDPGSGWAAMSFTDSAIPPGAPANAAGHVNIVKPLVPSVPDLATASAAQLPERMGSWSKTTIHGHAAWVAANAIMLQLAPHLQIAVIGDDAVSPAQIRRIAESLSAPAADLIPLGRALPASALS